MIRALKTPRDPPPPLGRYRRRGGGRWSRDTAECDRALRTRRQRAPPLPSSPRAAWREGVGRPPPGDRAGAHWRRAGASGHRCLLPVRRFAPRSLDRRKAEAVARPPPAPLGAAYRTRKLSRRRKVGRPPPGGRTGEGRRAHRPRDVRRLCCSPSASWHAPRDPTRPRADAPARPHPAPRGPGRSKGSALSASRGTILRSSYRAEMRAARVMVNDAFTLAPGARQFLP